MASISLCMIVKDEEEVLGRCLESVIPLVDEIVVVDTGSADSTPDCARRYGAQVHRFDWSDDFAAARNFSFSKAACQYILWLDADDVVLPDDLARLIDLKPRLDEDVYYLRYDYAQDEAGATLCSLYRERIVKNAPSLQWQYPVHECLLISGDMSSEKLDITITHRRTSAGADADQNRNLHILERSLQQDCYAGIPRLHYYLGKEYHDAGRHAEGIAAYRRFLEMDGGWIEDRIGAQQRLAECYYELSRQDSEQQAEHRYLARLEAKRAREMDARWAEPHFLLGQLAFDEQDYEEAAFWYTRALHPPPPVFSPVRTFCYELGPLVQLCICYDRLGDFEKANEVNERALQLRPGDGGLLYNRDYLRDRLARDRLGGDTRSGQPVKLNLGSGNRRFQDYINCDRFPGREVDEVFSLDRIPYPDDSVQAIHSEHALEHLYHDDARGALREWLRVLQPGGELILKLPDLEACCREFIEAKSQQERDWFRYTIYGIQRSQGDEPPEGQVHHTGFTESELAAELHQAGFVVDYTCKYDGYDTPSLAVRALKPVHGKKIGWIGANQDLRNPQYRLRVYHFDRWLRSRGYNSRIIDIAESGPFDTLIFFRRFTRREYEDMSAAKAQGKQVILDVCEDLFDLAFEWYEPMIRLADMVVCCSHALAERVSRCNPRVVVIEEAVEADFNLNCDYIDRERLRVAWIGMGGNARHAEALRPVIEELGYELIAIHERTDADIPWDLETWQQTLAGCDLAIAPIDEKLQPAKSNNKITNYMALGLPVIASPLDSYRRVIEHGRTGYLAHSPDEWTTLLKTLGDVSLRKSLGQAGKAAARNYHLDILAERWRALLFEHSQQPVVDIIIPTCGLSPFLERCVDSVRACTRVAHRIIVVNSGDPASIQRLSGAAGIVQGEPGLSFAQALNIGIKHSQSPYLCFLNDDVIVSRGWLEPLLAQIESGAGLCNPLSNCDLGWLHDYDLQIAGVPLLPGMNTLFEGTVQVKGINAAGIAPELIHNYNPGGTRVYHRDWVAFYCTLVSREVVEKVGLLDESFVNGCEDLDYCKRAAALGYECRVNEASFVFHFGGVSRGQRELASPVRYRADDDGNRTLISLKYERPLLVIHTGDAFECWTANSINQTGIGGSETAASNLAEEMVKLGYRAVVFARCGPDEAAINGVEYLDSSRFARFVEMNHMAVFIASRYVNLFDFRIRADRKYFWAHDVCALSGPGDADAVSRFYNDIDGIVCLSHWHRDFFAEAHSVPKDKIMIIGNGIDAARFDLEIEKQPGRFIYSSSPDRGLDTVLELFPRIRDEFPQAELRIFYGFDNWDKSIEQSGDASGREFRNRIYAAMEQPNVFFHGRVGQQRLAEEFMKSEVWFYPTRFTETYCITAVEAQMAGAVCICSQLAALETTVADRGVLIPGDAYSELYREQALREVFAALRDAGRRNRLSSTGREWAREQTWANRAEEWLALFREPAAARAASSLSV